MHAVVRLLIALLEIWVLCAVARAVLSWFPIAYGSAMYRINRVLIRVTEPLIAPVRRILPPARVGGVGIDLAFLVVFLGIQFVVIRLLSNYA